MNDRQTHLEELLAHQQRTLDELNSVITGMRDELDAVTTEHAKLKNTVARLVEHYEGADGAPDERPPHY